ncbi:MAG: L,D-transpeptidase family protein [Clostridia bacterium]|nr:L,D-transpeptidase family protein [Clostridia bacterium]
MRRVLILCLLLAAAALARPAPETVPASAKAGTPDEKWILIESDLKRLTVYQGTEVISRYPVATGAWDTPTPLGTFYVDRRFKTEMSGFGTRFLHLTVPWGQYGIHGTNRPESIGNNASHGCIRLRVKDAEALYGQVPNWTKVVIEGGSYGPLGDSLRVLRPGDRSSAVQLVQFRLSQNGFYAGADGVYGAGTSKAVLAARKAFGLSNEDIVDYALYARLGIMLFE